MTIAIDLHGTISAYPDIFRNFMEQSLIKFPDKIIYILSGPEKEQIKNELTALKFIQNKHYHEILSVVDYLKSIGAEYSINSNGSYQFNNEIWWKSKSDICNFYNIDILYDNEIRYSNYFFFKHKTIFKFIKPENLFKFSIISINRSNNNGEELCV